MGRSRSACVVLLVALGLWLAAPAGADEDRSYEIAAVDISAVLRPDGALEVTESRTFAYDGTYRGAFFSLAPRDGQRVELRSLTDDTGVTYVRGEPAAEEPGTYVVDNDGGFEVTWFYGEPATDTTRTFVLDYVVTDAATRHADVAELYWQWVGTGWSVPTGRVTAELRLPQASEPLVAGESLLLWAHGPPQGRIEAVGDDRVLTTAPALEPYEFLEARLVLPADALADAPASDGPPRRDAILAEERELAEAPERAQAFRSRVLVVLAVLGALSLGATGLLHARATPASQPHDLAAAAGTPVTSERPALVEYLVNGWSTTRRGLAATVLDLVQRGFVEARPTRQGLELRGIAPPDDRPGRVVYDLLGEVAKGRPTVTEAQLGSWLNADPRRGHQRFSAFQSAVAADAAARGWRTGPGRRYLGVAIGLGTALAGFVGLILTFSSLASLLMFGGVVVAAFAIRLRPPTATGRALLEAWRAERDRLRALGPGSELQGSEVPAAIALGLDDRTLAGLRPPSSPASDDRLGALGYSGYGYGSMYGGLDRAFPQSGMTAPSSSSGGGGGASSGGGGGGGGSGGGAF